MGFRSTVAELTALATRAPFKC